MTMTEEGTWVVGPQILAGHPEWQHLFGLAEPRPPTPEEQARYDARDAAMAAAAEEEAYAEDAARSRAAEPLPSPGQVAGEAAPEGTEPDSWFES